MATNTQIPLDKVDCTLMDNPQPAAIWHHMDEDADTLTVYFTGQPVVAVGTPVNIAGCYLLVDPYKLQAVGFKIEGYQAYFLPNLSRLKKRMGMKKVATPTDSSAMWIGAAQLLCSASNIYARA